MFWDPGRRRVIPPFSEMMLESNKPRKGAFPRYCNGWKLGGNGSPMWIRERPLISHGQIGESRYLKILGTHDWGMGGNKERAREPSRVCWPRGENADVMHRLSSWGPEKDTVTSWHWPQRGGRKEPGKWGEGLQTQVGGQDPG